MCRGGGVVFSWTCFCFCDGEGGQGMEIHDILSSRGGQIVFKPTRTALGQVKKKKKKGPVAPYCMSHPAAKPET